MKVDVKVAGASYSGVPAILLPLQSGGQARFCEVSDTTAVASDVASGKTFYMADGKLATGTNTGEGGSTSSGLPTYTITLPESEHQTITASLTYKTQASTTKRLTKTGTVNVTEFVKTNPILNGVTVAADSGYIPGKLSPVLTYPYELTSDLVFSVTDASEATYEWPTKLVLNLGELKAGDYGKYYTFATSSQNPSIPVVQLGFTSDGDLLFFTDHAENYGTLHLTGTVRNPENQYSSSCNFAADFAYDSSLDCLKGTGESLFFASSRGFVATIYKP